MVKVNAEERTRAEVLRIAEYFAPKWSMSLPGPIPLKSPVRRTKSNAIVELLQPMGIKELVRSGPIVLGRGAKGWKAAE